MKAFIHCLIVTALLASFCSGTTRIIGYWGCYPGGLQSTLPQLQTAVNKGYNVIVYAFYEVNAAGALIQDPGSVATPTKSAISSTQFTYLVSLFGGQNGIAPTLTTTPDVWAQAMYNNFVTLHNNFGFDGIDIDLENSWGGTGDQVVCGLRAFFKLMHNNGYFVSMAPQTTALTPEVVSYTTGSWNSYAPLADTGIIDYVDIVAVQLYNNAVPYNNAAQYANALINGFQVTGCPSCPGVTGLVKVPACKIAFGWPATVGAAPSGCPGLSGGCPYGSSLSTLYNGNSVLKSTTGVMTWSVEWDESAGYPFVTAAKSIGFTGCGATSSSTATTATSTTTTAKPSTATVSSTTTTAKPSTSTTATSTTTTAKPSTATTTSTTTTVKPSTSTTATVSSTTTATSSSTTSSSCTAGYMRCTGGANFQTCDHGVWQPAQSCTSPNVCSQNGNYVTCVAPSSTATIASTSTTATSSTPNPGSTVTSTSSTSSTPTPAPGCVNGSYRCGPSATQFQQCSNNIWYTQNCAPPTTCHGSGQCY